jgi:hypothetical protein
MRTRRLCHSCRPARLKQLAPDQHVGDDEAMSLIWQQFAGTGDQFLIVYAQAATATPAASLFTVGHAAELYLKAVATKLDPSTDAGRYGHRINDLLDRAYSVGLLADFQVSDSVRDRIMRAWPHPIEMLDDPDFQHYVANQELYWIAYFLADSKYLGAGVRHAPESFGVMTLARNPYWLPFFKELRTFLGWSRDGSESVSHRWSLDSGALTPDAAQFLLATEPERLN